MPRPLPRELPMCSFSPYPERDPQRWERAPLNDDARSLPRPAPQQPVPTRVRTTAPRTAISPERSPPSYRDDARLLRWACALSPMPQLSPAPHNSSPTLRPGEGVHMPSHRVFPAVQWRLGGIVGHRAASPFRESCYDVWQGRGSAGDLRTAVTFEARRRCLGHTCIDAAPAAGEEARRECPSLGNWR
jgi:hypothetical protein